MKETYEEALARYDDLFALIATGIHAFAVDEHVRSSVPMGIYEHFKSMPEDRKYYMVEEIGRFVDNGPYLVSYRSLYGEYCGRLAHRQLVGVNPVNGTLDGFLLPVDREGYQGPRFIMIEQAVSLIDLRDRAEKYRKVT
jgi:hypothetical protein